MSSDLWAWRSRFFSRGGLFKARSMNGRWSSWRSAWRAASTMRSGMQGLRSLGRWLPVLFFIGGMWRSASIVGAQLMLHAALSNPTPMRDVRTAVSLDPFDPLFRRALVEFPMLNQVRGDDEIRVARDGLTWYLKHDPLSSDGYGAWALYDFRVKEMESR